jgi:hypothetical protein
MKPVTCIWLTSLRTSVLEGLGLFLATFTESAALPFPVTLLLSLRVVPLHMITELLVASNYIYLSNNF